MTSFSMVIFGMYMVHDTYNYSNIDEENNKKSIE